MRALMVVGFLLFLSTPAPADIIVKTTIPVDPATILTIPPLLCVYKVVHKDGLNKPLKSTIFFISLKKCNKIRAKLGLPPITRSKPSKKEPPIELPDKENKATIVL